MHKRKDVKDQPTTHFA